MSWIVSRTWAGAATRESHRRRTLLARVRPAGKLDRCSMLHGRNVDGGPDGEHVGVEQAAARHHEVAVGRPRRTRCLLRWSLADRRSWVRSAATRVRDRTSGRRPSRASSSARGRRPGHRLPADLRRHRVSGHDGSSCHVSGPASDNDHTCPSFFEPMIRIWSRTGIVDRRATTPWGSEEFPPA